MKTPKQKLIDEVWLSNKLTTIIEKNKTNASTARHDILKILKQAAQDARKHVIEDLSQNRHGLLCAKQLSDTQDSLIRIIANFTTTHIYPVKNPSTAEQLTLIAVGGYGRGTLAPKSDIDLLFLLPYKQTPWGEQVVEYILYLLWDMGLKVGHATRNIDECVRLSKSDLTIRTTLLDARYLYGERHLFETLMERFDADIVASGPTDFVTQKLAERDYRHGIQGQSRYRVEPNVKEGKGGLRDLQTLYWIGKYVYRVKTENELITSGVFSRQEYNRFRKCADFLWTVRCHLHFLTNRAEERLSFDIQPEIAKQLGYVEHPGLKDVERFMKHYFLIAKEVGDLTRIFCAALEEQNAKPRPILDRMLGPLRNRHRRKIAGSIDFVIEHGRLQIADNEIFKQDPINLIRFFHIADKHDLALHPNAMQLLTRSLKLIDAKLRNNPAANTLFLNIITSKNRPEVTLRRMNESGFLGRFVPVFGKIVAMMQFNMYHHYTVDEHLIRSIGILAEIEHGNLKKDHPLSHTIIHTIKNRKALYVAVFLHDIAKGRPEDHSIAGAKTARRLCPRLGLTEAETNLVAWLIEHHLLMNKIAQSRDISDRKTILDFAAIIQTHERLKLLLLLTVADIRAVGPDAWNGWKGQLLRTLYYETEAIVTGGHSAIARDERVQNAKQTLYQALSEKNWPENVLSAYLKRHYSPYWLRVDLEHKIAHAEMIRKADIHTLGIAIIHRILDFEDVCEITFFAPDHPRFLAIIAGCCAAASADIVGAQVYTTRDGRALDTIFIRRKFKNKNDELRRADRISSMVKNVLRGKTQLKTLIAKKEKKRKTDKAFNTQTEITIDNNESNIFTVVEISGLDRIGLLSDLTSALANLNLNIGSAHIMTFGERVVDVFYITDLIYQKITNSNRITAIRRHLMHIFEKNTENDNKTMQTPIYKKEKS